MFHLFHKSDKNIYAPISGKCMDITEVTDKVFASKVMGDGFAVEPSGYVVSAPCDGVITMVCETAHAFAIRMDDGRDIFVHIGIDTVDLNGKGFRVLKKKGMKVKHGDSMIELDVKYIQGEGYPITTMVIINESENEVKKLHIGEKVTNKDIVIAF